MITYRAATKKDYKQCVELLTNSFDGYPYFEIFIENKKRRYNFLKAIQEVGVRTYLKKQTTLLAVQDNEIAAIAQIKAPNDKEATLPELLLMGGLKVFFTGGIKNTFGWLDMFDKTSSICHDLKEPSWYLSAFAVSSSFQKQGVGSKMLQECVIPHISLNGGGVFTLITNAESNRAFYIKNGFTEFHTEKLTFNNRELGNWAFKMTVQPSGTI